MDGVVDDVPDGITSTNLTLGSLFDGIGGFPYAGSFFGIKPLWASEIMPQAISVTQRHLPDMEHVGDITQLDGATLPPVDIITFGSPCQGLSMAGRRLGLADERSGLFSEAIRIIDEMRMATDGRYPRYAIWENVPGALSSNAGFDYQAVLEAFAKTQVPIPRSGKWANSGMVRSDGIDLAWCVYNAQYFGVPQRRRRIFLVCDFSGRSAGEILFKPKSLSGYFAARRAQGQNLAGDVAGGADGTGVSEGLSIPAGTKDTAATIFAGYGNHWNGNAGAYDGSHFALSPNNECEANARNTDAIGFDGYNGDLTGDKSATLGINCGMSTGRNGVIQAPSSAPECLTPWDTQQSRIFTEEGLPPTLAGADGGGGRNPAGLVYCSASGQGDAAAKATAELAGTLTCVHEQPFIYEPKSKAAGFMGNASSNARSIGYAEEVSPTLRGEPSPCVCKLVQADAQHMDAFVGNPTITVLNDQGGDSISVEKTELSPTLRSETHGNLPIVAVGVHVVGVHQGIGGDVNISDTAYCLSTNGQASGRNAPLICEKSEIVRNNGTVCACEKIKAFSLDSLNSNSMLSSNPLSGCREVETAQALVTASPCPSKNQGGIAIVEGIAADKSAIGEAIATAEKSAVYEEIAAENRLAAITDVHPKIVGTLTASASGMNRPGGMGSETDLCVAYCLQGNMIGRQDHNGPRGNGVNEETAFTLTATDVSGVAALFKRQRSDSFTESNIAGTQTACQHKGQMDLVCETQDADLQHSADADTHSVSNGNNTIGCLCHGDHKGIGNQYVSAGKCIVEQQRSNYIVRRLLPVECERLQGYPDGWTQYGHDGKEISDTRRYQMLGNSVAVPCVAYILLGIAEQMNPQQFPSTAYGGDGKEVEVAE